MDLLVLIPFLQNVSLLLVFSVILEVVYLFSIRRRRVQTVVIGAVVALICIGIMTAAYTLPSGIAFDSRSILIGATAMALGSVPAAITAAAAVIYRLFIGGIGMLPDAAAILAFALIGLGWRRFIYPRYQKWRWLSIYLASVIMHAVMLACMLLLPYPVDHEVIRAVILPVLTVFPVVTALLCLVLIRQQKTQRLQEELKQSEERFHVLFDQAPMGYQSLDADGNITDVNQRWLEMFGYTHEEVVGKWFGNFINPKRIEEFGHDFALLKSQGKIECNLAMRTKAGEQQDIWLIGKIRHDDKGEPVRAHCILQDITGQKKAQEELRASEEKYGSFISHAPDAIVIVNGIGKIFEVNAAAVKILGYSKEELKNQSIMDIIDPASMEVGIRFFKDLISRSMIRGELEYRHKGGSRRWASISGVQLAQNRFLCFISDISEQKWAVEKLVYKSIHDELTGLFNRRYFDTEMQRLDIPEQLPLSFIIGDINGLKLINDSLGHAAGDRLIAETARFISGFCRPEDVLARTSGDQFSLILPQTDFEAAEELVSEIQDACRTYNEGVSQNELRINLAMGAGTKTSADEGILKALKQAEDSMERRKFLNERQSQNSIIATIKAALHEKNQYMESSSDRITHLARLVGSLVWMTQSDLDTIELLAEMHDIGKIGISEEILNKRDKLTETEWEEIRKHPVIGERIAMSASSLAPIANYILCQHERWDGSGYPQGLEGKAIPLMSRILAVVDAYDAMTQDRIYRKAMSHEDAIAEIQRNAGTQFDPNIVRIFCEEVFQEDD